MNEMLMNESLNHFLAIQSLKPGKDKTYRISCYYDIRTRKMISSKYEYNIDILRYILRLLQYTVDLQQYTHHCQGHKCIEPFNFNPPIYYINLLTLVSTYQLNVKTPSSWLRCTKRKKVNEDLEWKSSLSLFLCVK